MTRLQLAYSLIPYFVVRFTASGDLSLCGLIKKEPPDLSIVKRLGRFYWCKDNGNILNGKRILNSGNTIA